jgi:hypothetical protein
LSISANSRSKFFPQVRACSSCMQELRFCVRRFAPAVLTDSLALTKTGTAINADFPAAFWLFRFKLGEREEARPRRVTVLSLGPAVKLVTRSVCGTFRSRSSAAGYTELGSTGVR